MKLLNVQKALLMLHLLLTSITSGCANYFAEGFRDPDDPARQGPTMGGRWQERGLLAEEFAANSRGEAGPGRSPASDPGNTWIAPERRDALERESRRDRSGPGLDVEVEAPTFSSTPNFVPAAKQNYRSGRVTRNDFVDHSQNEGSLWASDGQTNYYFTKNKVRSIGDIVAVKLDKDLHRDIAQEIKRSLNQREREHEIVLAQERLRQAAANPEKPQLGAPPPKPAAKASPKGKEKDKEAPSVTDHDGASASASSDNVREATYADIDVTHSIELKPDDTIMGEIVERYPNGNYKVRGIKKVPYKPGAARLVSLVGIVKSNDITEDDSILSSKLYEYRLEAAR